jgi:site-specific DNA recombinase
VDAIYARVSGPGQTRDRTVEAQLHDGRKWNPTAREFVDDGVSGFSLPLEQRPAGRELMQAARTGQVARLWVWNVDRLGRNAEETLSALRALHRHHVTVLENGREILTGSASGNLEGGIKAVIAQYARDQFIENSRRGKRRRFREGHWPFWQVPYGYALDSARCLTINEAEASVVRWLAGEYARGVGVNEIVSSLNARGITAPAGAWSRTGVYRMLRKSLYRGEHAFGQSKGHAEDNTLTVPVIIAPDLAALVDARDGRGVRFTASRTRDYPLRGVLRCSCGYMMTGQTSKGYVYYRCSSANHGKTCGCRIAHALPLEAEGWASLTAFLSNDAVLEAHIRAANEPERVDAPRVDVGRLERRRENLIWRLDEGLIGRDEFRRDMQEVATQLKAAQAGPIVVPLDRAVALATVERVREGLRNGMASDGERGEVLRAFNDNSRWDRERAVWRWTLARAGAVVYQES